jgi:hypothetical protein
MPPRGGRVDAYKQVGVTLKKRPPNLLAMPFRVNDFRLREDPETGAVKRFATHPQVAGARPTGRPRLLPLS